MIHALSALRQHLPRPLRPPLDNCEACGRPITGDAPAYPYARARVHVSCALGRRRLGIPVVEPPRFKS